MELEFEITPAPTLDERAALVAAVAQALADDGGFAPPQAPRSRWRAAGVREALDVWPPR